MMSLTLRGIVAGAVLSLGVVSGTSVAQDTARAYPAKVVRVVMGFSPGGSDVVTRIITQRLSEKLGQPFVIDYRPGATSTLGSDIVAKSAADGYTLLFATGTFTITAVTFPKLPYDVVKDFAPIASIGAVPMVLTTHPSLPVNTVKEFIAFAKARPGQLDYASAGAGGGYHLSTLLFATQHGLRVNQVPYKGSNPGVIALIGGEVQFMFPNLIAVSPHIGKGRLKALAIAHEARSPLAPDLPTMAEAGVRDFREGTWYGFLAPRATPANIVSLLNQEMAAALQLKETRDNLARIGVFASTLTTPEQFSNLIKADIAKWDKLLKTAGKLELERF
jgi:tripartite-type tricarboxylate transporter receptor subunit TctC